MTRTLGEHVVQDTSEMLDSMIESIRRAPTEENAEIRLELFQPRCQLSWALVPACLNGRLTCTNLSGPYTWTNGLIGLSISVSVTNHWVTLKKKKLTIGLGWKISQEPTNFLFWKASRREKASWQVATGRATARRPASGPRPSYSTCQTSTSPLVCLPSVYDPATTLQFAYPHAQPP